MSRLINVEIHLSCWYTLRIYKFFHGAQRISSDNDVVAKIQIVFVCFVHLIIVMPERTNCENVLQNNAIVPLLQGAYPVHS